MQMKMATTMLLTAEGDWGGHKGEASCTQLAGDDSHNGPVNNAMLITTTVYLEKSYQQTLQLGAGVMEAHEGQEGAGKEKS